MLRLNHFRQRNAMRPLGWQRKGYALAELFCLPV